MAGIMKLSLLKNGDSETALPNTRRGVLTAWSIFVILAAGLIAGGLFNVIWLSGIRNKARLCTESAALAAGYSFLSDDLLRFGQQSFEHEGRATRCQNAAIAMIDECRRNSSLPPISQRQVQLDWPESGTLLKNPAMFVPNGIRVSFDSPEELDQVPLFFSGLTGIGSARLGVSASVILEHSPEAFRPGPNNSVPMLPFAISDQAQESEESSEGSASGYWTTNIESGRGADRFSWDSTSRQFESGPDGLPEVTVTISAGTSISGPDAFVPLSFSAVQAGGGATQIPVWIDEGLTMTDLRSLGLQEVSFPGSLPTASMMAAQLSDVAIALRRKVGEPSLVCLYSLAPGVKSEGLSSGQKTDGPSGPSITLTRPVAVRIVQVDQPGSDSIRVILQPCVMVTSTAITARNPEIALNRYVYSVRLGN